LRLHNIALLYPLPIKIDEKYVVDDASMIIPLETAATAALLGLYPTHILLYAQPGLLIGMSPIVSCKIL